MIPLKTFEQEQPAAEVVDNFFFRLTELFWNNINDIELDKSAVVAYLERLDLREEHSLAALSDIESYISVVEDVLFTATQLSKETSIVSQEFLVDWAGICAGSA